MVDPNTRQGKRTPVTLKIKFKSETLEQFIERYAVDVSQGGIFIRTKEPLAVGTQMKFEFQLKDASPLISGEGTVVWTRENDPSRPAIAPGMGVRFDRLGDGSQPVLEKILSEKAKQAPQRGSTESVTKPPMFTDTPTRVAPAPVQDALGVGRNRSDSEQTPLPKPMPFHSAAEDFDENAFQEATKVRSLDELAAQSGLDLKDGATSTDVVGKLPPDELAARRGSRPETPLAEPPAPLDRAVTRPEPDRDSAPRMPNPPEAAARPGKLLDTTPSPRSETPASTKVGLEPAKAATSAKAESKVEPTEKVSVPRPVAVASEPSRPIAPKRPSIAPIIIAVLVVIAAAGAGVWWFVIKPGMEEETATPAKGSATMGSGSQVASGATGSAVAGSGSSSESTGSGVAMTGSAGSGSASAGSAQAGSGSAAKPVMFDVAISANAPKATLEIVGTDQGGPAPIKAKLEKDKSYKVHAQAPGFLAKDVDLNPGQAKLDIKLDPKPHVVTVTSEPPGASIFIDGVATGKQTPADIDLSAAQAAKPKLKVMLRKAGYRAFDQTLEASSYAEDDAKVTGKVDARLVVMQVVVQHPTGSGSGSGSGSATPANSGTGSGSGSGSGSGTGSGSGSGSASGTGSGSGSAAATPPAATGTGGSAEPEPDWTKRQ